MLSLISRRKLHGPSLMLHRVDLMNNSSMGRSLFLQCSSVFFIGFNTYLFQDIINYFFFVVRILVNQGCIKPLCDLLICPDPRIVTVCLEGLENILKVGEADKNVGNTEGVNLFAQMIDDAEGLEKIENLQSHDNTEIYEKAVKILETYWLEEDDETMPTGEGFNFGGSEVPSVPTGGFNFN